MIESPAPLKKNLRSIYMTGLTITYYSLFSFFICSSLSYSFLNLFFLKIFNFFIIIFVNFVKNFSIKESK